MIQQRILQLFFLMVLFIQLIHISLPSRIYANSQPSNDSLVFFDYEASFVEPSEELSPFFDNQRISWDRIQEAHHSEIFIPQKTPMNKKKAQEWMSLCNFFKKSQKIEILQGVNNFMNSMTSKDDKSLYNKEEYWATPAEFLKFGAGDCEDYVFAKYFALIYLDWPTEDLWNLMIFDEKHKDFHVVLGVKLNGKRYILDNLAEPRHKLFDEAQYAKHIIPISMLNSQGLWIFKKGVEEYYNEYVKKNEEAKKDTEIKE